MNSISRVVEIYAVNALLAFVTRLAVKLQRHNSAYQTRHSIAYYAVRTLANRHRTK